MEAGRELPGLGVSEMRHADRVAAGYAELLGRTSWQLFGTHSFRIHRAGRTGGVHPEAAHKAFRFFVSTLNRDLYGRDWGRRWHRGCQWAVGEEFHKDGRLHLHSVISAPTGDLYRLVSFRDLWQRWFKEFGVNRMEAPRSQGDVVGYVAKYVAKDGNVTLSPNFGAWLPPRPSYLATPGQPALVEADQQHSTPGGQLASHAPR